MAVLEYKCPNCGGAISFDATAQQMKCPYCESTFDVQALIQHDKLLSQPQPDESVNFGYEEQQYADGELAGMVVYSCTSCGGEIVGSEVMGATSCPFCGNPVVVTSKFSGDLRPDAVIPFKLTKEQALAALKQHYLGKKLLPKVFKDQNHLDEIKGIYVPYWLFDADAVADLAYHATTVSTWSDSDNIYTRTSHYSVLRAGALGFNLVPMDGSSRMDDAMMESIEPFDFSQAVDFQTAYLAGFFADRYDVTAEQAQTHVADRVVNSTASAFRRTVSGYASVTTERQSIQLQNGKVRYALLPVWVLSTSWEGNAYTFAMNGQTGKFVGDLPMDKGAFWRWFLAIFGGGLVGFGALATLLLWGGGAF
ncbi:MAG: hypothetical protein LBR20_00800 [Propionibacteriaceae bacterium]|jgi:DNA-directed RNA polymerase subunit RPC12/RpoP|nr:hypothetical protein [Propionibacteriaceae bacterium]